MKKVMLFAGLIGVLLTSCAEDTGITNEDRATNETDRMFTMQVAMGNRAEIMAGQLAAQKGTNTGVKSYGQLMVDHHTTAQAQLKTIAANAGLPAPDSVSMEHQMLMQRLNSLTGYSFDTAYINSQVRDHQKTLSIFQMEVNSGRNPAVRNFATQNIGMIQMHYNMADSIRRRL